MGDLIARLCRVRLTEQGVGTYLRCRGLPFQCPDKRAVEQDAETSGSGQVTGRTWGAEGCTLVVRRRGNRFHTYVATQDLESDDVAGAPVRR